MTRVLHFSDVHVEGPFRGVPLREFIGKRFIGLANLKLLRGRRHRDSVAKLEALADFMKHHEVDVALCTGDYTVLGTEPEIARAREVVEPFTAAPQGLVTMPGNHDIYMGDAVRDGRFDRHFGELMGTDRPDLCTDGRWPLVRLPSEDLAIVAVNSARPNPQPWRSSGRIREAQLRGLEEALRDPEVQRRFVIVATHYAPRLRDGRPDTRRHGLDNADALLDACRPLQRGILAHGHVHHAYHVRVPGARVELFGAGSATHAGREGLWIYDVHAGGASARRGRWGGEGYVLDTDAVHVT